MVALLLLSSGSLVVCTVYSVLCALYCVVWGVYCVLCKVFCVLYLCVKVALLLLSSESLVVCTVFCILCILPVCEGSIASTILWKSSSEYSRTNIESMVSVWRVFSPSVQPIYLKRLFFDLN